MLQSTLSDWSGGEGSDDEEGTFDGCDVDHWSRENYPKLKAPHPRPWSTIGWTMKITKINADLHALLTGLGHMFY